MSDVQVMQADIDLAQACYDWYRDGHTFVAHDLCARHRLTTRPALDVDGLVEKVAELLDAQDAIDNWPANDSTSGFERALSRRQCAFGELSAALAAIKDATDAGA